MNTLRNSVRLIGNLGMDPEVRELDNGRKLARLSLATSSKYKDQDGNQVKETQWHSLVAWGRNADIAERYLRKGIEVAIEGKLTTKQYTDKSGNKRYSTEIQINEILMIGGKTRD